MRAYLYKVHTRCQRLDSVSEVKSRHERTQTNNHILWLLELTIQVVLEDAPLPRRKVCYDTQNVISPSGREA